ncbi:MAG TPA: glycosyltransferase family A protein [Candidatus Binataceae bacterium]|nr:glycosyltransferase family A protein [Candidatus Binataceae bacterium]
MTRMAVVIPAFNSAATISRAIDSALRQNFDGTFDVIVVNDGSTDSTIEVLMRYDGRIRVVDQQNQGPASARNAGVALSNSEYIAFLDADDAFLPSKLAWAISSLENDKNAAMLFHDAITVHRDGHEIARSCVPAEKAHAPSMQEMLTELWPIILSTVVIRRTTFDSCGGFSEEFRIPGYEDPDLWIRAREHGHFIYLAEPLTYYTLIDERTERMEKYLRSRAIFFRRLRQRYGEAAEELIHRTVHGYTNWLSYQGLLALRAGDRGAARRYFAHILRHHPAHMKSALRYIRTFLPTSVGRALSGRTAGTKP